MGRMFLRSWLLFASGVAVGALAHAARPFMTDDARVTTTGSCQVEAWARHAADRSESWLLPACNPNGHFEVTAGGGRFRTDGAPGASDHVIQGKTLLRALSPNDWGWGVAVGQVTHPGAQPGLNPSGSRYIYVPLSLSMRDDQVVVHMNLGWTREQRTRRDLATWGVGVEYWAHPKAMLIAETFGDDRQKPWLQTGLRLTLIPGLLQIDATRGVQPHGGGGGWRSLGLRYTPDKLF